MRDARILAVLKAIQDKPCAELWDADEVYDLARTAVDALYSPLTDNDKVLDGMSE